MLINGISNPCRPANSPRLGWRGRRGRGRHHPGQERTKSPPGPNWHNGMSFITGPPFFTGRPSLPAPCAAHRGRGRKRLCHAQPRQTVVSQRWHRHASVFGSCLDTLYANIGLTSSLALFFLSLVASREPDRSAVVHPESRRTQYMGCCSSAEPYLWHTQYRPDGRNPFTESHRRGPCRSGATRVEQKGERHGTRACTMPPTASCSVLLASGGGRIRTEHSEV